MSNNKIALLSISGGKDSTAMALLAREREVEPIKRVFADTGHEHPATYEYLDYLETVIGPIERVRADFSADIKRKRRYIETHWPQAGIPASQIALALETLQPTGVPFLDLCMMKGRFPSARARFCTQELKHFPIERQIVCPLLEQYGAVESWQGVRAQESPARANLPERERGDLPGLSIYRPLLTWTVDDVFATHRKHNIKPNPLYKQGAGRVGCSPCIMARKGEIAEWARRWPEEVARVREWERIVAVCSKRGLATFFAADKTPGEHNWGAVEHYPGIESVAAWATDTSRGGRNIDWIEQTAELPACSSIYGLCE